MSEAISERISDTNLILGTSPLTLPGQQSRHPPMRLKALNGAPLQENLDFSEGALHQYGEDTIFRELLVPKSLQPAVAGSDDADLIKWRRLETTNMRLRSGLTQQYPPATAISQRNPDFLYSSVPVPAASFDSVEQTSFLDDTMHSFAEPDDFLQHSLALHDTLVSSQIAPDDSQSHDDEDYTISASSFLTTTFEFTLIEPETQAGNEKPILQLPATVALTPLGDLPTPRYLRSIYPQTPTPSFVCAATAEPELKQVYVRKGGYSMDVYEVNVADDSCPDFKVSFWFRPGRAVDQAQKALRTTLEELKVGDILLLRNIVLNIFREVVYGQSLSSHISKARTTVEILARADGASKYKHIVPVAAEEQFAKVKRWAKAHIVSGIPRKRQGSWESPEHVNKSAKMAKRDIESLPPDTQL